MDRDEQAARNQALAALRRPEKHTPWEVNRPAGWKLIEAIYGLTLPDWRKSVSDFLADVDVGLFPEQWPLMQDHFWRHILFRLQAGELVAQARRHGGDTSQIIPLDMLDDAEPDFANNRLTCGGVVFGSIRVFPTDQVMASISPVPPPVPGSTVSVPPKRTGNSLEKDDAPLLDKMAQLIAAGHATGAQDAARAVVHNTKGKNEAAIVTRLAMKFNKRRVGQSGQS